MSDAAVRAVRRALRNNELELRYAGQEAAEAHRKMVGFEEQHARYRSRVDDLKAERADLLAALAEHAPGDKAGGDRG